jgi:hypothetical protein
LRSVKVAARIGLDEFVLLTPLAFLPDENEVHVARAAWYGYARLLRTNIQSALLAFNG